MRSQLRGSTARVVFHTLAEAKILIEQWRRHYKRLRPHSSLGYRPPAPEVLLPMPRLPTGSGSSQGGMTMTMGH